MWILESEGDLFQGRRMWLKPGKKYLFGRVRRDGVQYALDHKTISRQHFIVTVEDVKAGDSGRIHARTKITITDEKSKHGTYIDGRLLQRGSRDLSAEQHSIRPGSFPTEIVIKWIPCNLTFQITKKDVKAGVLKAKAERLESIDVKVSADYLSGLTTHVVAAKRNTPKGLQALIQGKYLVGDAFIDALEYAATPADLGEEENLSPLELDFSKAWPGEAANLAPRGKEPTERPDTAYEPDPKRTSIFDGFQFVFLDKAQYENLLPVITTGQGKALHFELKNGKTTVDELIRYMRSAAGKKNFGDTDEDSPKGGAIMVLQDGHPDHEEWTADLIREVALKLDQRAVNQAEFLDAILASDGSLLKTSLAFESSMDGRRAPQATPAESLASIQLPPKRQIPQFKANQPGLGVRVQSSSAAPVQPNETIGLVTNDTHGISSSVPEAASQPTLVQEPPRKKPRLRHVPLKRSKHFDDEFDVNAVPSYTHENLPRDSQFQNASVVSSREHSLAPSMKDDLETTRKHPRSTEIVEDSEEDLMEDIFPAAAALRRQRGGLPEAKISETVRPMAKKKRLVKEMDVREAARAQRQAEEEAAEKERKAAADTLTQEENLGKPGDLVVVEEMPLRAKVPVMATRASADAGDRWDPEWNGRKNFKKFRRSGTTKSMEPRRLQKVLVPLVEAKGAAFGLGDHFVDSEPRRKKRSGISQSQSQSQSQPRHTTQSTSQAVGATNAVVEVSSDSDSDSERHPQTSPQLSHLQAEAASIVDHAVDAESPRRTRLADKTQSANVRTSQKRPASRSGLSGKEKRQKTIPTSRDRVDDSDSDGMKFKFGRRKR